MKLPINEAKKCILLLDGLDMYTLRHSHIANKNKIYFDEDIQQLRADARQHWQNNPTIIDDFISTNKELSTSDADIIRSWKNITKRDYILIKHYKEYSVFASSTDKNMYGVLALSDDFDVLLPSDPPLIVETSLLPYKGHIVWDGLVAVCPLQIDQEIKTGIIEECEIMKKRGMIITSIGQYIDCDFQNTEPVKHCLQNRIEPAKKIGRNDQCHCGSNKKYKKCCLNQL